MKTFATIYGVVLGEMICLSLHPHHWMAFVIWAVVGGGVFWAKTTTSDNYFRNKPK